MRVPFLEKLAFRLRPELRAYEPVALAGQLLNMYVVLIGIPLGILSMIWLWAISDPQVIVENAGFLFILFLLGFLFDRYPFELQIELRPGVVATSGGTLYFVVVVSALFIFGAEAFWISIVGLLIRSAIAVWKESQPDGRWAELATMSASLATGAPSVLLALYVYQNLGGQVPLTGYSPAVLLPALAFVLIYWILPFLILAPLLLYLMRAQALVGQDPSARGALLFFLFFNSSIPNLAVPFTFFAAILYAANGPGYYHFFLAGILLTSMLANRLTNTASERNQRARELGVLEALGRDIITAPPENPDLKGLLEKHLPGMFFRSRLIVWLDPDDVLFRSNEALLDPAALTGYAPAPDEPFRIVPPGALTFDSRRTAAIVPIEEESGDRLGLVYLDRRAEFGGIRNFLPGLQSLAAQIASAVYREHAYREALQKQRMENELALAGRIQANFLPESIPELPGYEIAASLTPALQTSGDFYDFIPLPEGRLGFVIADVADKGTGAALFMALTRTLLRTYALEHPEEPERVFQLVNARVHADTQSQLFITTFYGIIDPVRHVLTYVNGGHNPPYLLQPGGVEPAALGRTGIPIGMLEEGAWQSRTIAFPESGLLALYTDGVTEAQNAAGDFFDEAPLLDVLQDSSGHTAESAHRRVQDTLADFVGDAPQFDDITLVVIKRHQPRNQRDPGP